MKLVTCVSMCVILGLSAFAQNKRETKLYGYIAHDQFEKLRAKSLKILKKDRPNIHANYAMSVYYISKHQKSNTAAKRKSNLSRSVKYLKYLPHNTHVVFDSLHHQAHQILINSALDSTLKTTFNKQYRKWLWVLYQDAVPRFTKLITPNPPVPSDRFGLEDSLRLILLQYAKQLEGVKYKYAGTSPKTGFDCSGFTQYVYQKIGVEIPHNAQLQSDLSPHRQPIEELNPGDLIFFGSWNGSHPRTVHAGIIFQKKGAAITVIHCVSGGVRIEGENSSWDRYWINRVLYGISLDSLANK